MFTLIKEGNLYAPEPKGTREILVVVGVIALVAEQIDLAGDFGAQVISARGKLVLPGFVDLHVHLGPPLLPAFGPLSRPPAKMWG